SHGLIRLSSRDNLPGKPLEHLADESLFSNTHRPLKGQAAVAGVHNEQYVLRWNDLRVAGQFIPPNQGALAVALPVHRHQITDRTPLAVNSHAVTGEKHQQPVV